MVGIRVIYFFKFIVLMHRFYTISNQQMFIKIVFVYMNPQNSQQPTNQQYRQDQHRNAFNFVPQPNTGSYVIHNPQQYQPSNQQWSSFQSIPSDNSIPTGIPIERARTNVPVLHQPLPQNQPSQNHSFPPESNLALRVQELEQVNCNLALRVQEFEQVNRNLALRVQELEQVNRNLALRVQELEQVILNERKDEADFKKNLSSILLQLVTIVKEQQTKYQENSGRF